MAKVEQSGPQPEHSYRPVMTIEIIVAVLVLIAIVVIGSFYYQRHKNATKSSVVSTSSPAYNFIYKDLGSFTVGAEPGQGMSFLRPAPFGPAAKNPAQNWQIALQHLALSKKEAALIGGEGVAISKNPPALPPSYLTGFNKAATGSALKNPSSNDYQQYLSAIKYQTRNLINDQYDVTLISGKSFSNPGIKSNSWKFNFSATAPTAKTTLPEMRGLTLYTVSENDTYLFTLYSVKQNWQPNQDIWNKILGSIKIDQ